MNDPLEGRSRDVKGLYNVIFCSSWCNDNSKNGLEYMWENYSNKESGVRINLPTNPFKEHSVKGFGINSEKCNPNSILPPEYYSFMIEGKFDGIENLIRVNYTDDIDNCFPKIKNKEYIKIYNVGKHKTKRWKIEREWRYILYCCPRAIINFGIDNVEDLLTNFCIDYIYVDLKDDIFKEAEILVSKNFTNKNMEKLIYLQNKYGFKLNYSN